jgi:hypothetical protein
MVENVEFEITQDESGAHRIALKGLPQEEMGEIGQVGCPVLPVIRADLALPINVNSDSLEIKIRRANWQAVPGLYDIAPAPPIATLSGGDNMPLWPPQRTFENGRDVEVYATDAEMPLEAAHVRFSQSRKWKMARVSVCPFRYNPALQTLSVMRSFEIEVDYTTHKITDYERRLLKDTLFDERNLKRMKNKNEAERWYRSMTGASKPGKPGPGSLEAIELASIPASSESTPTYVILTCEYVVNNSTKLDDFIDMKEERGYDVVVCDENETWLSGKTGDDAAEAIHTWLASNYDAEELNIAYVLIIGYPYEWEQYETPFSMKQLWPTAPCEICNVPVVPSDLYYAELNATWDDNPPDGYYPVWGDDEICETCAHDDCFAFDPEVYVGRIPWKSGHFTIQQLDDLLERLIDYQTDYEETSGEFDWRKEAVIAGAILNFEDEDDSGVDSTFGSSWGQVVKAISSLGDYETLYERDGLDIDDAGTYGDLTAANLKSAWNTGPGFVLWLAHGAPDGADRKVWDCDLNSDENADHPSEIIYPVLIDDYANITHKDAIVVQCSCWNADPDTMHNLAEKVLYNISVGTVAATRPVKYKPGLGGNMSKYYAHAPGYYVPYNMTDTHPKSLAMADYLAKTSKSDYGDHYHWNEDHRHFLGAGWNNLFAYNIYGDPSLSIIDKVKITTAPPLPYANLNEAYLTPSSTPVDIDAVGGVGAYTWSIDTGSLPAGLSLSSTTGVISGTPTATGTSNFTVRVEDGQNFGDNGNPPDNDEVAYSITVLDTLVVTTTTLPNGQVGEAYSETLSATGGLAPYTWSVVSGSLPAGLTLGASTGVISGTPTAYATSNFTVRASDSQPDTHSDDQALSITVIPADLVITTTSLPDAYINGAPYNQTLEATGGATPLTWSIVSGSLPEGLSLASATGVISGTQSTAETANFTVRVTDSYDPVDTDDQALSIVIHTDPGAPVITTTSLPTGGVGTPYNQTVGVDNGIPPLTWSVTSGSLPGGLSLDQATGVISGTPTTVENQTFTVQVTDSAATPRSDDQELSLQIVAKPSTSEVAVANAQTSTKSTSYTTKAVLTFTPTIADEWVILGFCEYKGSSTSYSVKMRMLVDGATKGEILAEPNITIEYQTFTAMAVMNLSAASHTIRIQYASENSTKSVYARNARIIAVRKEALEWHLAQADTTTALTTTLTDYATLNWTPTASGDYLLLWSAEFSANTGYYTKVQAKLNGNLKDECQLRSKDNTDYMTFLSALIVTCGTSEQTATITAAKQSGSGATHNIRRARLLALRLSGGRMNGYHYAASDGVSENPDNIWEEKLTKSWSPSSVGDWLALSTFRLSTDDESYAVTARVQLDDSTTLAAPFRRPRTVNDWMNGGMVGFLDNLGTGSRHVDVDWKSPSWNCNAQIKYARVVILPLDQ